MCEKIKAKHIIVDICEYCKQPVNDDGECWQYVHVLRGDENNGMMKHIGIKQISLQEFLRNSGVK